MGATLILPLFFADVKGQLAAAQAEVVRWRRASKDLARQLVEATHGWNDAVTWAHSFAVLA